jgi:long-chain acyl-CoA synthetase
VLRSAAPAHNLATLLLESARRHPALPAVCVGSTVLHDYAGLAVRVSRLAATLAGAGLEPRDRVIVVARNAPGYIEVLFACWQAGVCAVPVNSKLHASELAYVLVHSGARWAFVDDAWYAALA